MAKIKKILCNPITWIVVCFVVMVATIVGVILNYVSLSVSNGGFSGSFTLADLLSSKQIDYNVIFTYTFKYNNDAGQTVSTSGSYSIAATYSDWSQLSSIGWVYAFAFISLAMAVLIFILQVINKFVKKEAVKEVLYVTTNVASFALLVFGILALGSAGLFIRNLDDLLIGPFEETIKELSDELYDNWLLSEIGMTYNEASKAGVSGLNSDYIIPTTSLGVMAGPVLLCLASIIGGIFNISMCSAKVYKIIK